MMVVILEMMVGIMQNNNKVNIHCVHSLVKMISHMLHKLKTMGLGELVQVLEPLEIHIEVDKKGWHNEYSFSASFEAMSIGTQYSDSSNDANIFPFYTMSYGQPSSNPSASIDEEYG